jgi:L-gulono-1,4-lactone dehydrogenase
MQLARRRIANFGRNVSFVPAKVYWPRNVDDLLACMRLHPGERIRCIGAGHSWSEILATEGVLFDLRGLRQIEIDPATHRVRVGAGCTLDRLLKYLRRRHRTLPTLGAIKKQTVAGAIATATHGTGRESLSHFVEEVRVATFDTETGEPCLRTFRDGPELLAARCALGSLGIVVEVTLQTRAGYNVEEQAQKTGDLDEVLRGLDENPPWHLQQFALFPWSWRYLVYRRRETAQQGSWLWARLCRCLTFWREDVGLHVVLKILLFYARLSKGLRLLGFTGSTGDAAIPAFFRWADRWVSGGPARIDDSTGILTQRHDLFRHVEMEVFVPESKLRDAIPVIQRIVEIAAGGGQRPELLEGLKPELRDEVWKLRGTYTLHYIIFFRRVLPEDTLVSMASRGTSDDPAWYSISFFTYRKVDEAHARFAGTMARCLIELYGARLHWGKYFPVALEAAARAYPRFEEFREICRRHDPKQRFWY